MRNPFGPRNRYIAPTEPALSTVLVSVPLLQQARSIREMSEGQVFRHGENTYILDHFSCMPGTSDHEFECTDDCCMAFGILLTTNQSDRTDFEVFTGATMVHPAILTPTGIRLTEATRWFYYLDMAV